MPRYLIALPVVALSAIAISVASQPGGGSPPAPGGAAGASPNLAHGLVAAARVGLSPNALAAAEVDADGARGVLADLAASPLAASLRSAETQLAQARQGLTAIVEACRRGGATPERLAERSALVQQIRTLRADRDARLAELRAQARDALASRVGPDRAALAMRLSLNARREVAEHHRALDLNEEAWRALESATLGVRRGLPLSPAESAAWIAAQGSALAQTVAARQLALAPALQALYVQQAQAVAQP